MALTDRVIRLREINGVIYASSRTVAEDFGKDHKHVLRDIEALRKEIGPNLDRSWFRDDQYFDSYNRPQDCIDMSRQGWELVVMNYRGMIDWKVAYILKFEEMEAKLGPGARTAALFDRTNPAFQGPAKEQGELALDESAHQPSVWSPSYNNWRKHHIETQLPRPTGQPLTSAQQRHLDCISDMATTPRGYGDSTDDKPTNLMREELPKESDDPAIWRASVNRHWRRLPMELRRQWWRDTDYGARDPSPQMIKAIIHIALP